MSLQLIMGASGSGKSSYLFDTVTQEAKENKKQKYVVIVPDQFTLETQKALVEKNDGNGIINVDVLSFNRLAYRVLEQLPAKKRTVLDDMGKMMILRRVFSEQKNEFEYFKSGVFRPGFLDECKSFLTELAQYGITPDDFDEIEECLGKKSQMSVKIRDLRRLYDGFNEKMGDVYMMAEELIVQLTSVIDKLPFLKDAVVCFDGFTGFTPTQYDLISVLLTLCKKIYVTVTTDRTNARKKVFKISLDTIERLTALAQEKGVAVEKEIVVGSGKECLPYRIKDNKELLHLEENIFANAYKKYNDIPDSVEIHVARKESEEAKYVARKIWWLVKNGNYNYEDIAVVTANLEGYENPLIREFERMNIRYFLDDKKKLGANAMTDFIMSFMAMVRKDFDYETTFAFLKNPLSVLNKDEVDVFENYVIAKGRRGKKSYESTWKLEKQNISIDKINEYRKCFMDSVSDCVSKFKKTQTVKEFTMILYSLLESNNVFEKLLELSKEYEVKSNELVANEYKRVYGLMMNFFENIVEILGDEVVTAAEYEEMLGAGISQGLVAFVPPQTNQVVIGDMERTRLDGIKVLFFVGVNDDVIPKNVQSSGILSSEERRKIENANITLAPNPEERSFREKFYIYLAMTKASERLYVSFSKMNVKGESKRPAYLIRQIRNMFPQIKIVDEEKTDSIEQIIGSDKGISYLAKCIQDEEIDDYSKQIIAYYLKNDKGVLDNLFGEKLYEKIEKNLSKEAVEALYVDLVRGSVSSLQTYVQCPYMYFISSGLKLKEREKYDIDVRIYGNVMHRAMELMANAIHEKGMDWKDYSEDDAKVLSDECMQISIDELDDMFTQTKRKEYMIKRMKKVFSTVSWGMLKQMQDGSFVQKYQEETFSDSINIKDGKKLSIYGIIDRMDVASDGENNYVKIVDYKTGSPKVEMLKIYHGLQMQLVTYLSQAIKKEKKSGKNNVLPAAILYYILGEPELEFVSDSESEESNALRTRDKLKCEGYINIDENIVELLDENVVMDGEFVPGAKSLSYQINVLKKENKAGEIIGSKSKILTTEEFNALMDYTESKMVECADSILDGNISAMPYKLKKKNGCEFCEFSGICKREKKYMNLYQREFEELDDDVIWEELNGRDKMVRESEKDNK